MAAPTRTQIVNPRIGVFYSIFASAILCLILTLLIVEQLRVSEDVIRNAMLIGPLALYLLIGTLARATDPHDYLASGRRVPAVFNGLSLFATTFGATGLVALTGLFYMIGHDALAIAIGFPMGLLFMAVLFVPYLRKHGAYTISGYFAHRFQSRLIRPVVGLCLSVPVGLLILAEINMGVRIAAFYFDQTQTFLLFALVGMSVLTMLFGGMRAATWASGTQATVTLIGILLPLCIVATMLTNLPLPQVTYAAILKLIARSEAFFGILPQVTQTMDLALPGPEPVNITKPFNQPYGAIGETSFTLLMLSVALGTAAMPSLLNRAGTSISVFDTRKAMVWALVLVGGMVLMIPAAAAFVRHFVFSEVANIPTSEAPAWLERLADYGFAFYDTSDAQLSAAVLKVSRDAVLFTLPAAADLPKVFTYLIATGIFASSLAALSAHLLTLGNMLSEDLALGFFRHRFNIRYRSWFSRLGMLIVAIVAIYLSLAQSIDPLLLMLWGLTIAASTLFPALFVSIWWKRATRWGVAIGMAAGLATSLFYINATHFLGMPLLFDIPGVCAAVLGLPVAVITMLTVSVATPAPATNVLNIVRDIRIPGGETFHDREERLARMAGNQRDRMG